MKIHTGLCLLICWLATVCSYDVSSSTQAHSSWKIHDDEKYADHSSEIWSLGLCENLSDPDSFEKDCIENFNQEQTRTECYHTLQLPQISQQETTVKTINGEYSGHNNAARHISSDNNLTNVMLYYQLPNGQIYGPYLESQILNWLQSGYFTGSLLISMDPSRYSFVTLLDWINYRRGLENQCFPSNYGHSNDPAYHRVASLSNWISNQITSKVSHINEIAEQERDNLSAIWKKSSSKIKKFRRRGWKNIMKTASKYVPPRLKLPYLLSSRDRSERAPLWEEEKQEEHEIIGFNYESENNAEESEENVPHKSGGNRWEHDYESKEIEFADSGTDRMGTSNKLSFAMKNDVVFKNEESVYETSEEKIERQIEHREVPRPNSVLLSADAAKLVDTRQPRLALPGSSLWRSTRELLSRFREHDVLKRPEKDNILHLWNDVDYKTENGVYRPQLNAGKLDISKANRINQLYLGPKIVREVILVSILVVQVVSWWILLQPIITNVDKTVWMSHFEDVLQRLSVIDLTDPAVYRYAISFVQGKASLLLTTILRVFPLTSNKRIALLRLVHQSPAWLLHWWSHVEKQSSSLVGLYGSSILLAILSTRVEHDSLSSSIPSSISPLTANIPHLFHFLSMGVCLFLVSLLQTKALSSLSLFSGVASGTIVQGHVAPISMMLTPDAILIQRIESVTAKLLLWWSSCLCFQTVQFLCRRKSTDHNN